MKAKTRPPSRLRLVAQDVGAYPLHVAMRFVGGWRSGRGRSVLIVASDAVAREVYGELFALRGHHVVTANDAREGLRRARCQEISTVVLALGRGEATALRRRLLQLRPGLTIHVTGQQPQLDPLPQARRQLH